MYDVRALNELVAKESAFVDRLLNEVGKVIVGQEYMVERILVGLLTGGHVLLEGVPGLAKTLTVRTLCDAIHAKFARIQFTPDLLPADLVGTVVYNQPRRASSRRSSGPSSPTWSSPTRSTAPRPRCRARSSRPCRSARSPSATRRYPLPEPFVVMATQNPIEQEGTYPLPEAQIDRFMIMVKVGYPTREEERKIMDRMTQPEPAHAEPVRHAGRAARRAQGRQAGIRRREGEGVHRRRRLRDARAGEARDEGPCAAHRVRGEPAREHRAQPGGTRARVPAPPGLRDARRREGRRAPTCCATGWCSPTRPTPKK